MVVLPTTLIKQTSPMNQLLLTTTIIITIITTMDIVALIMNVIMNAIMIDITLKIIVIMKTANTTHLKTNLLGKRKNTTCSLIY